MIRCPACGSSYEEDCSECPVCGFPNISMIHATEEEYRQIQEKAAEYRKTLNIYTHVFLQTIRNELNEQTGTVSVRDTEAVFLGNTKTMQPGTIYWYPEFFAAQHGPLELRVLCLSDAAMNSGDYQRFVDADDRKVRTVKLANPESDGFWRVGIQAEKDGGFRLCVGSSLKYTCSDPVSCGS